MMEEKRFLDFLDMFDGGGAGQMGDKFEGGGLLSAIGNAFGSPYGSEDPERRAARQAFYGSDQIGGAPMTSAPPPQVMPQQVASEPNYADRFGVPAGATEPNYADRFGVPASTPAGPGLAPGYEFAVALAKSTGASIYDVFSEVQAGKYSNAVQRFIDNNYQLPPGY